MVEATIRDVARRADVSIASVSRALNGLANVAPETRERVERAAAELGYVPHSGARSLSLARTGAIGVLLPDLHGEFFSEIMRGMDREATRRGYMLFLSNMHAEGGDAAASLRAMRGRVDGMLLMAPHVALSALAAALPARIPAVLINGPAAGTRWPSLRFDNRAGAAAMVDHLVDAGRRAIVHVRGPAGNVDADEREEGYRAALARRLPDAAPVVIAGDFHEEAGAAAADAVLAHGPGCDAVFAANDMMAIGCLQALRAAGVAVPGRIAVAGFDDVPLARYLDLTTMRVEIAGMGERAVAVLLDALDGTAPAASDTRPFQPQLIVRATTTPPTGDPA